MPGGWRSYGMSVLFSMGPPSVHLFPREVFGRCRSSLITSTVGVGAEIAPSKGRDTTLEFRNTGSSKFLQTLTRRSTATPRLLLMRSSCSMSTSKRSLDQPTLCTDSEVVSARSDVDELDQEFPAADQEQSAFENLPSVSCGNEQLRRHCVRR